MKLDKVNWNSPCKRESKWDMLVNGAVVFTWHHFDLFWIKWFSAHAAKGSSDFSKMEGSITCWKPGRPVDQNCWCGCRFSRLYWEELAGKVLSKLVHLHWNSLLEGRSLALQGCWEPLFAWGRTKLIQEMVEAGLAHWEGVACVPSKGWITQQGTRVLVSECHHPWVLIRSRKIHLQTLSSNPFLCQVKEQKMMLACRHVLYSSEGPGTCNFEGFCGFETCIFKLPANKEHYETFPKGSKVFFFCNVLGKFTEHCRMSSK